MKTRLFIFVSVLLISTLVYQESFACSCAANPDYFETLANADTAFQGTVIKTEDGSDFQKVHFMIHSVQKGDLKEGYFVMTNVNLYFSENETRMLNSCDPNYSKGNTYQVFGWGITEQNSVGQTNMCSTRVIGSQTLLDEDPQEEKIIVPHDPYSDDESLRLASEKRFLAEESMGFGSGIGIFNEYSFTLPIIISAIVIDAGSGIGLTLYWRRK